MLLHLVQFQLLSKLINQFSNHTLVVSSLELLVVPILIMVSLQLAMELLTVFNTLQLRTHGVHHGVKMDMLDLVLNLEQVSVVSTNQPPNPPQTDYLFDYLFAS